MQKRTTEPMDASKQSGDYSVFYTIQRPFVTLLVVTLLALRPLQVFASSDDFPSPDEIAQLLGKTHAKGF